MSRVVQVTPHVKFRQYDTHDVPFLSPIMSGSNMEQEVVLEANVLKARIEEMARVRLVGRPEMLADYLSGLRVETRVDSSIGSPKGVPRVFATVIADSEVAVIVEHRYGFIGRAIAQLRGS